MTRPTYSNVNLIVGTSPLSPFNGDHRFFLFSQNNSGGSFYCDKNLAEYVIIAARDAGHANERARELGIYFDGAHEDGPDCECCGDRWYEASGEGDELPLIYNQRPESIVGGGNYCREGVIIHLADGTRESYHRVEEKNVSLVDLTDDNGLA